MMRPDYFFLGYRVIKVDPGQVGRTADVLLSSGTAARITNDGVFRVRQREYPAVKALLEKHEIPFSATECLGLFGIILKSKEHIGLLLAFAFFALAYLFFSGFVWDVRLEGESERSVAALTQALAEEGLYAGRMWRDFSADDMENRILASSDEFAWININRRGVVAYVTFAEKKGTPDADPTLAEHANIVATRDAIVEEITVRRGVAAAVPGQTVREGELLISGVLSTAGGTALVAADGTVMGRVSSVFTVHLPRDGTETVAARTELVDRELIFFGKSINIFKRYRNPAEEYDIIEDETQYVLFGQYRLPVYMRRTFRLIREEVPFVRTDEELTRLARETVASELRYRMGDSDVLKLQSECIVDETGITVTTTVVHLVPIGKAVAIDVR